MGSEAARKATWSSAGERTGRSSSETSVSPGATPAERPIPPSRTRVTVAPFEENARGSSIPSRRRRGKLWILSLDVIHIYHGDGAAVREVIRRREPERHVVVLGSEEDLRAKIGDVEVLF